MYMVENETRKNNIPNSYWNYALEHSGLFQERPMEESRYVRIDIYWNSINGILNEFGKPKYTQLFALVKAILSLSHGNVVPERVFSINKYLLPIHGNSTDEKTIVALRLVKDFICSEGGFSNIIITREILQSVKSSHSRYQVYLEVQRKLNENEGKLRLQKEKEVVLMKEREEKEILQIKIGKDIEYTKQCIHQLENNLKDANDDLAKVLKGNFKREEVVKSHTIIQMPLDRKRVLESTLED